MNSIPKRQQIITNFFPITKANDRNLNTDVVAANTSKNGQQVNTEVCNGFADISYLPIYYQNVRSIPAKTNLRSRISNSIYKVFCFTETWLNKDHANECYFPSEFNVYRQDRKSNGGGVAILVHERFKSAQIDHIFDGECESICVKIEMQPVSLVLYVAYVNDPQKGNILLKHWNLIHQVVSLESKSRFVVLGDFNLHDIVWNLDDTDTYFLPQNITSHTESEYYQAASKFLQKMHYLPLFQLSNAKNISSNVLDLVFVNGTEDLQLCNAPVALTKVTETDRFHPPLEMSFEYQTGEKVMSSNETIEVFSYKRGNYERMSQQLDAINFAQIFDRMDIETAFDYFYELLNRLIIENIPTIQIKVNNNRPKWWTHELQRKKNKRDKMYKRKPKNEMSSDYTEALKEFNELHDILYKDYINKVQGSIIDNPAEFWRYAKAKKKTSTYPMEMKYKQRICDKPREIVELFADYFEDIYVKDDEPIDFDEIYGNEPVNAKEINLTMFDIEKAINQLKAKSNAGPDKLSPIVMKNCIDALVWPLWILHQKSMEMGKISTRLKLSRVVPVYKKKGDKRDVENYRIVAISSVIMRIYESAMNSKLIGIIDPLLSNAQHGFRPRRSISTNLLNLSVMVHEAFSKKQQLDVFYGDFANAFDKVWHRMLINKIRSFNIGKKTTNWLFEFIDRRKFFVVIGNIESRVYESTSGVPAGSIMGPTLFLISIDDIADCVVHASVLLFADDIKMALMVDSLLDTRLLQSDIQNVLQWSETNKLPFNLAKCEVITMKRRNDFCNATYFMGAHVIERKYEIRDLGILVDPKFTFGAHIEQITAKARQALGYIRSISKGQFGIKALKVLYTAYVRSKLEFGSVIWDPYQQIYRDDIESIQKQFVMYVLGDNNRIPPFNLPPYEARCKKLNLDTLVVRRNEANFMMAFDLFNKRINDRNIDKKFIRRPSIYQLRENKILTEMIYDNDYEYNQPLAKIIRLINEFKEFLTLNRIKFKVKVKEKLREK